MNSRKPHPSQSGTARVCAVPRSSALPPSLLTPLLLALLAGPLHAQTTAPELRTIKTLSARDGNRGAMVLRAQRIDALLGQRLLAQGEVELRHTDTLLRAPSLVYEEAKDEVSSPGPVELEHLGNQARGHHLRLQLEAFIGELLEPQYRIAQTGGSGKASRLDFLGDKQLRAADASYSSCPREENVEPDWELQTQRLELNLKDNVGEARGAVLRFLGVPILAAPGFSFPLGDERKSGWLPPHVGADNRSGIELAVPYYFNLAPNYDATLTPFAMTRRGFGADGELRWLGEDLSAELSGSLLPHDRALGQDRWSAQLRARGELLPGLRTRVAMETVSDDDYWKDLRRRISSPTPRLLAREWLAERSGHWGTATAGANWQAYARMQAWQVLQTVETATRITAPYQREPQLGLRLRSGSEFDLGFLPARQRTRLEGSLELEYNRFTLPRTAQAGQLAGGERVHLLGDLSLPLGDTAWWFTPRLRVNSAEYRVSQALADGRRRASRTIPSFSIDTGLAFERDSKLLGRAVVQSLEPRLLYVQTPYRAQDQLPNFDSAPRDFNVDSIYSVNEFTGIDRVADARQLAFGAVSRWVDANDGDERLRLGLVQRYQFRPQQITAEADGVNRRFSDLLLAGAAHLSSPWWADAAVQYDPDGKRSVRTVLAARYQPGPFRTVSLTYRLTRGQNEQMDLAWQWPLWGRSLKSNGSCQGAWYSAGRVQYSLKDSRVTDSLLGVEYDAGCWVLRMGVERLSTGLAESSTRFLLQLELVGLSRFGSNALKVLRDNVPGYRPLASDKAP